MVQHWTTLAALMVVVLFLITPMPTAHAVVENHFLYKINKTVMNKYTEDDLREDLKTKDIKREIDRNLKNFK